MLSLFAVSDNANKTIVDIIQDEWHIFRDKNIARVLLNDVISKHNYVFSIDSNVEYISEIQERIAIWNRLKISVKEKSRFFTNMDELLSIIILLQAKVYIKVKNCFVLE